MCIRDRLLRAASAIINGGTLITPHFAVKTVNEDGETTKVFEYERVENAVSGETSGLMTVSYTHLPQGLRRSLQEIL